jgi:hypothetical protein
MRRAYKDLAAAQQNLADYGLDPADLPLIDALALVGQQLTAIETQIDALRKVRK